MEVVDSVTPELSITEVQNRIDVTAAVNSLATTETVMSVDITGAPSNALQITEETLELEVIANAVNQTYSGEGAVADGTTIEGDGTTGGPLSVVTNIVDRALGSFQITNNLSEIPTEVDRQDAQQNLGLHIIDGGTFI